MITELALQEVDEAHELGGVNRQALSPLSGPRKAEALRSCAPRFSAQDQGLRSCRKKQTPRAREALPVAARGRKHSRCRQQSLRFSPVTGLVSGK